MSIPGPFQAQRASLPYNIHIQHWWVLYFANSSCPIKVHQLPMPFLITIPLRLVYHYIGTLNVPKHKIHIVQFVQCKLDVFYHSRGQLLVLELLIGIATFSYVHHHHENTSGNHQAKVECWCKTCHGEYAVSISAISLAKLDKNPLSLIFCMKEGLSAGTCPIEMSPAFEYGLFAWS